MQQLWGLWCLHPNRTFSQSWMACLQFIYYIWGLLSLLNLIPTRKADSDGLNRCGIWLWPSVRISGQVFIMVFGFIRENPTYTLHSHTEKRHRPARFWVGFRLQAWLPGSLHLLDVERLSDLVLGSPITHDIKQRSLVKVFLCYYRLSTLYPKCLGPEAFFLSWFPCSVALA